MKRENRYIVIKRIDAAKVLTATEDSILSAILAKVQAHRNNMGKKPLRCVVVEDDWPEYEHVWKMIEQRVDTTGE